uniref:Receptor ligand binding region domain-containing protein n=1 Tax=Xenopus tropicalis TaxID=8364 RepID=A0A803JLF0_XENTR
YLFILCIGPCRSGVQPTNPACHLRIAEILEDYEYIQNGDIIIGGLLTVNTYASSERLPWDTKYKTLCVNLQPRYYRQLVELRLAVEEINKNSSLFPNLTLGYHIYDSCGHGQKAVRSVLQILSGTREPVPNYSCDGKRKIVGFIGDLISDTTIISAQILSLFGFSQISYGASDPLLSDRAAFPYFFRTLQSFYGSSLVVSKLLKHFGWTWVGIIRFNYDSGENELQALTDYFSRDGICVEFTIKISHYLDEMSYDDQTYSNRMKEIIHKSTTNIIVVCGKLSATGMSKLMKLRDELVNKTLIFSPSASVIGHIEIPIVATLYGSLILAQYTVYPRDTQEIMEFIHDIHPSKDPGDKLLEDILLIRFKCSSKDLYKNELYGFLYETYCKICTDKDITKALAILNATLLGALSPHVHLAVTIMSRAVHEMHRSFSEGRKAQRYQYQLHHYLKTTHYQTKYGGE